jgi:copper chaperone
METVSVKITGMSCGHCVQAVRKELLKLNGVEVQEVQIGSARLSLDPLKTPMAAVEAAIAEAGFQRAKN